MQEANRTPLIINKISWVQNNPKKTIFLTIFILFCICDLLLGFFFISEIEGERHAYYHHTLKKYYQGNLQWGGKFYSINTNSLGFKDSEKKEVELSDKRHRILIIGDSFTEGIGLPYQKTFVGIVDKKLNSSVDILNAGVKSYSPKLYYLKVKYLIENIGLRFNELFVYIDISDIQDEIVYESFIPALSKQEGIYHKIDSFINSISITYNKLARKMFKKIILSYNGDSLPDSVPQQNVSNKINMAVFYENYYKERPKWTSDKKIFNSWGQKGLVLAKDNMDKLISLCKRHDINVTIAVYPWPFQIKNAELNSLQVGFWETFAKENKIGFINYFPDFINSQDPEHVISQYFILGDNHWNERGHKIIANKLLTRL